MISIAIITVGICAVICTFIICVTKYNISNESKIWKDKFLILSLDLQHFIEEFNATYSNTRIELTKTGIKAIDVEKETEE